MRRSVKAIKGSGLVFAASNLRNTGFSSVPFLRCFAAAGLQMRLGYDPEAGTVFQVAIAMFEAAAGAHHPLNLYGSDALPAYPLIPSSARSRATS